MAAEENRFIQSLQEEDLHPDLRVLVPLVGMEVIRIIMVHFPGQTFYFQFTSRMTNAVRRYVIKHYHVDTDGRNNAQELARECGVTVQHIRRIYRLYRKDEE